MAAVNPSQARMPSMNALIRVGFEAILEGPTVLEAFLEGLTITIADFNNSEVVAVCPRCFRDKTEN